MLTSVCFGYEGDDGAGAGGAQESGHHGSNFTQTTIDRHMLTPLNNNPDIEIAQLLNDHFDEATTVSMTSLHFPTYSEPTVSNVQHLYSKLTTDYTTYIQFFHPKRINITSCSYFMCGGVQLVLIMGNGGLHTVTVASTAGRRMCEGGVNLMGLPLSLVCIDCVSLCLKTEIIY